MALDAKKRRHLIARANRLKAVAAIAAETPAEDAAAHLRRCFTDAEMVKLRIHAEDRATCEAAAARVAAAVPCEIVQRVGRVVTLYRPREDADNQD
jgi:RNA-binding protein YhbY